VSHVVTVQPLAVRNFQQFDDQTRGPLFDAHSGSPDRHVRLLYERYFGGYHACHEVVPPDGILGAAESVEAGGELATEIFKQFSVPAADIIYNHLHQIWVCIGLLEPIFQCTHRVMKYVYAAGFFTQSDMVGGFIANGAAGALFALSGCLLIDIDIGGSDAHDVLGGPELEEAGDIIGKGAVDVRPVHLVKLMGEEHFMIMQKCFSEGTVGGKADLRAGIRRYLGFADKEGDRFQRDICRVWFQRILLAPVSQTELSCPSRVIASHFFPFILMGFNMGVDAAE